MRDYRLLLQRWHALVVKNSFLHLSIFGEADGYPLVVVESKSWVEGLPSLYLSAGIHGDEPAGVEGLFQWASEELHRFGKWNWQIFPCLNPWGLERNIRCDGGGNDLNRCFDSHRVARIKAQLGLMKGRHYDLAACLHEDYDSRGFYLYEIAGRQPYWGESLCGVLSRVMPADSRGRIEGHAASSGLIRRRIKPSMMKGHPEAFGLHFHHAERTFTLETPSEESLGSRVCLHKEFIAALTKKIKSQSGILGKRR